MHFVNQSLEESDHSLEYVVLHSLSLTFQDSLLILTKSPLSSLSGSVASKSHRLASASSLGLTRGGS